MKNATERFSDIGYSRATFTAREAEISEHPNVKSFLQSAECPLEEKLMMKVVRAYKKTDCMEEAIETTCTRQKDKLYMYKTGHILVEKISAGDDFDFDWM